MLPDNDREEVIRKALKRFNEMVGYLQNISGDDFKEDFDLIDEAKSALFSIESSLDSAWESAMGEDI